MNTHFWRFKTQALQTMAGDALKVDVNNATSNFQGICFAFCMCMSLYDGNKHWVEHLNCRNRNLIFYVKFCRTTPYLSLHSDIVRVSVVLAVASQLSKLWRNDRDPLANRQTLKRNFWGLFVYAQNAINANLRPTLRHVLTESLEFTSVCENIAFVLNNNYK